MSNEKIYFNREEVAVLAMGLASILEDFKVSDGLPWTPEARKYKKDISAAAKSAAAKLEKFGGVKCDLPEYKPEDENEFFTKES